MNAEQLLTTRFAKKIWNPFVRAVKEYRLIREGDRIAVCVSGGKDSALLSVLMRMLQAHSDIPFEVCFLSMNPGYSPERRAVIEHGLEELGIVPYCYETKLFDTVARQSKNPCFLCARLRRGSLYAKAQELGCNKIALGHHFDDVTETILMSVLYGGQVQTMKPKLYAEHYEGVQVIRPMYLVRERDVIAWRDACGLTFPGCSCSFAEKAEQEALSSSKRQEIKLLLAQLEQINPQIPKNVFNSVKNIDLDDVLGWHRGEWKQTFLDGYEDGKTV